ncbi:hypothetical protein ACLB1M_21325 [Escherichia coli]
MQWFIPAGAETLSVGGSLDLRGGYRRRGKHNASVEHKEAFPSPLARGTLLLTPANTGTGWRFIPAGGKTHGLRYMQCPDLRLSPARQQCAPRYTTYHHTAFIPAGGEHAMDQGMPTDGGGLSPLARETQLAITAGYRDILGLSRWRGKHLR